MLVSKRAQHETLCWSTKEHSTRLNVGQQKSTARDLTLVIKNIARDLTLVSKRAQHET